MRAATAGRVATANRVVETRASLITLVLGLLFVAVYFFDGRWGFLPLGGLLVIVAVAGPRLRMAKMGLTSLELQFGDLKQRVTSELKAKAEILDGGNATLTAASIEAAARDIAAAPTPETFARVLAQFVRWRGAPEIEVGLPEAAPVVAHEDYQARYYGESAFLTLRRGQYGQLAVAYQNIGTKAWVRSTEFGAELRVPADQPDNRRFASNWIGPRVYARQSVDYVSPGTIAYFVYNIAVPADAELGVYRFWFQPSTVGYGPLADDGGYQDIQVVA